MPLELNKKNTKYLIQASALIPNTNKAHIDWDIDNNHAIYGCLYFGWFKKRRAFLLEKYEDRYRLITSSKTRIYIYLIEDVDIFFENINVGEIEIDGQQQLFEELEYIKTLPSTGILSIAGDKLFLYDFIGVVK